MVCNLLISVYLNSGRYHGKGETNPSPARLFQALVAGAARGHHLPPESILALEWLETLAPPIVACPRMIVGQSYGLYVPNNDTDIELMRVLKKITPKIFDERIPFQYLWKFEECDLKKAQAVCSLAERIYQFGWGIDMAWSSAIINREYDTGSLFSSYPGMIYHPSKRNGRFSLRCPVAGSLRSLIVRHQEYYQRLKRVAAKAGISQSFSQPCQPRFVSIPYDSSSSSRVFRLQVLTSDEQSFVWPLARAPILVALLRDAAVERLKQALPARQDEIERYLVGRKADGRDAAPASDRVRILPLPSIGHSFADRGIRRILVEVPANCPFPAEDVFWAFSGIEPVDRQTGEVHDLILVPADDDTMLKHYCIGGEVYCRRWRTITPVAVPESARRRRIEPSRRLAEAKDGTERDRETWQACLAIKQALRHADIRVPAENIRVQREPFAGREQRVEAFAPGTRFAKERLWHVEIDFSEPIRGPLVIGDGRFLGLGLMAPVVSCRSIHIFQITGGLLVQPEPQGMAQSLRRAVMARVQRVQAEMGFGNRMPAYFSGHSSEDSSGRAEEPHLSYFYDPVYSRLIVVAPHVVDHRVPLNKEVEYLGLLDRALVGMNEIRAGSAGKLSLASMVNDESHDHLMKAARMWESIIPYQVTRHAKHVSAAEAFALDIRTECQRRGLPVPQISSSMLQGKPGKGLIGMARLKFAVAVQGPVSLGRTRHLGGGLFTSRPEE